MKNIFAPLESDDDVLLINQETFTVKKFKDLLEKALDTKLKDTVNENKISIFDIHFCILSIGSESKVLLNDVKWCNFSIDCQLLQAGSQGWLKGKIKIQIDTKILWPRASNRIHAYIEFCPDEPTVSESSLSSLDDLQL